MASGPRYDSEHDECVEKAMRGNAAKRNPAPPEWRRKYGYAPVGDPNDQRPRYDSMGRRLTHP